MAECFFNGCTNSVIPDSFKCIFHSQRGRCLVQDCRNQVYARNLCVRHGGKRPCAFDGCNLNSRVGKFCTKHSPTDSVRRCSHEGCQNQSHLRGKCFRHGGSKFCMMEGCVTYARNRGYCTRHTPPHLVARRSSVVKTEVKVENILPDHSLDLMLDFDPLVDTFDISPAPQLEHVTPTDWGVLVSLLAGSSN
ncbi:hypothetical protein Ae201684P_019933 [Aphanomyces euteiches]|uniref:Uncharacterized protein n=1 Tax=Aphanomyces euteiches TaxID=100861 RepID=A0A6G0XEA3_9STRA|nr:hypothetical protein Ae201684_005630 [Aphanomyces euteiches]KAH9078867.1 hypothetical protein Ae201684P_019933 [Aphanomyces euteiches]